MKNFKIFILFLTLTTTFGLKVNAQITVATNQTATALAQMLAGPGVTISNAVLNAQCDTDQAGKFIASPNNIGMDSGIILTSGSATLAAGIPGTPAASQNNNSDPDLALLTAPSSSKDACVLEFDFIPLGDTVKFKYRFGSSEYNSFTCSGFVDAFGFFVSGPGITGPYSNNAQNIALLPNGCFVSVNTVNGSTASPCGTVSAPCAPPNNALFVVNPPGNTTNTSGIAYNGYTAELTAIAVVTPCLSHHLKLAICDAADQTLDSGVFLEAGSLSSNAIAFQAVTNLSLPDPYLVEGCAPGAVIVSRPLATATAYTVSYSIGGSATNGVDYQALSGQAVIPANQTTTTIPIVAFQDGLSEGVETITIYKQGACDTIIADSVTFFIYDKLRLNITTSDTSVCQGESVQIAAQGDASMQFVWTPVAGVSNDTLLQPIISPSQTQLYVLTGSLNNSGCVPVSDSILITVNYGATVNLGADKVICKNGTVQFNPAISPPQVYTYQWTSNPSTAINFLNNTTTANPIGTFTTAGTYTFVLRVDPTAVGCSSWDTIIVKVLPNDFLLVNPDTVICNGNAVQAFIVGPNEFSYNWTPNIGVSNDTIKNPLIFTNYTNTYTAVASFPGCPIMQHSFKITVEPVPAVNAGPDRFKCFYDTVRLGAIIFPDTFT